MAQLTINEGFSGYTSAFRFNYEDLKTPGFLSNLGAANQRKLDVHVPGGIVDTVAVYVVTPAAGASDLTIDVGTTAADPDDFVDNVDLDALTKASFNTGDAFPVGGDANTLNGVVNNTTGGLNIIMEVNGTHASLTAGEWIVAINQKKVPLG
jgi:hypothetical protein